jgi:hypothetical protein
MSYRILSVLLASLALISAVFAAETPTDVVHQLTDAIRKADRSKIASFYATLNGKPAELSWLDDLLASDDNDFISPTWCVDAKTEGDAAAVIVATLKKRGPLDLDPCYLIRRDSKWLILPEHTRIEVARGAVPEPTMKGLETLKAWYDARKKEIYEELEREAKTTKPPPQNSDEARTLLLKLLSKMDPKGFPTPRRNE